MRYEDDPPKDEVDIAEDSRCGEKPDADDKVHILLIIKVVLVFCQTKK